MEPATDTHPRTCTPAQPDPHQPEHPARNLPGTPTAPGYASTFCGRAAEAARVRHEIAAYLDNCPAADGMILIASDSLAANAILHTRSRGSTFHVSCQLSPQAARIEVEDLGGPWRQRNPGDRPHGLDIIQALTGPDGWGTQPAGAGGAHRLGTAVMVTARQPGPAAKLPKDQCAIAAANIRALRQRNGWTQSHLGHLMGWTAPSTVCATCGGHPPPGYACLTCQAARPAAPARPERTSHPVAAR